MKLVNLFLLTNFRNEFTTYFFHMSNSLITPNFLNFSITSILSFLTFKLLEAISSIIIKESDFCGIRFSQLVKTDSNSSRNNSGRSST